MTADADLNHLTEEVFAKILHYRILLEISSKSDCLHLRMVDDSSWQIEDPILSSLASWTLLENWKVLKTDSRPSEVEAASPGTWEVPTGAIPGTAEVCTAGLDLLSLCSFPEVSLNFSCQIFAEVS